MLSHAHQESVLLEVECASARDGGGDQLGGIRSEGHAESADVRGEEDRSGIDACDQRAQHAESAAILAVR